MGTYGAIIETEDLFVSWSDISPVGIGTVYRIVITTANPRRIVMATDAGVFWSPLPAAGSSSHSWQKLSLPGGTYAGLALGRGDRIVAAAWGGGSGAEVVSGHFGIFYGDGDWSVMTKVSDLNLPSAPSRSFVTFAEGMGRTSVASCSQHPEIMYAISSDTSSKYIHGVLKSGDNGNSWRLVDANQALQENAGGQGDWNNCIAVAPTDPTRVLFGWQAGTFQLTDSGKAFTQFDDPAFRSAAQGNAGLHDDVHAVYFDPADLTNNTFYICSDGGVAKTRDGGKTFDSNFNRYLTNLECYQLSVRGNLMACALQDNSNVYCWLRPGNNPNVSPWVQVDECDGVAVGFIATGQLISSLNCEDVTQAKSFQPRSDYPVEFVAQNEVPVRDHKGDDKSGLQMFQVEPVTRPTYANFGGQKMYAVACGQRTSEIPAGTGRQTVYGLFADLGGNDIHWENIGSVASDVAGDLITCVAALDDGTSVLVGTNAGRLFLLGPSPTGPTSGQQLVVSSPQGKVNKIVFASATLAFAASGAAILRFDGRTWTVVGSGLPGGPYWGLTRDGYSRTWTCTDGNVFVSRDDGLNWKDASFGLPRNVLCRDLRYNFAQQNPPLLYLATYGHSVWVNVVDG